MRNDDDALLIAYVSGDLPADAARAFEARVEADPALKAELAGLVATRELLGADARWGERSGMDVPPPHLVDAIVRAEVLARPPELRAAIAKRGDQRPFLAKVTTWLVGGGVLVGAAAAVLLVATSAQREAPSPAEVARMVAPTPASPMAAEPASPAVAAQAIAPDAKPTALAVEQPRAEAKRDERSDRPAGDIAPAGAAYDRDVPAAKDVPLQDNARAEADAFAPLAGAKGVDGALRAGAGVAAGASSSFGIEAPAAKEEAAPGRSGAAGAALPKPVEAQSERERDGLTRTPSKVAAPVAPPPPAEPPPSADDEAEVGAWADAAPGDGVRRDKSAESAQKPSAPSVTSPSSSSPSSSSSSVPSPAKAKASPRAPTASPQPGGGPPPLSPELKKLADESRAQRQSDAKKAAEKPEATKQRVDADRARREQEAQMALATGARELSLGRALDALDAFIQADVLDRGIGRLGVDPVFGQMRAYLALKRYDDVLRLVPRLPADPTKPGVADALLVAADAAERKGDKPRATELYTKAAQVPAKRSEARKALRRISVDAQSAADEASEAPAAAAPAAKE